MGTEKVGEGSALPLSVFSNDGLGHTVGAAKAPILEAMRLFTME